MPANKRVFFRTKYGKLLQTHRYKTALFSTKKCCAYTPLRRLQKKSDSDKKSPTHAPSPAWHKQGKALCQRCVVGSVRNSHFRLIAACQLNKFNDCCFLKQSLNRVFCVSPLYTSKRSTTLRRLQRQLWHALKWCDRP